MEAVSDRFSYDTTKWRERFQRPVNSLQVFITNQCNKRCKACFFAHSLGAGEMALETYKKHIEDYRSVIEKVILLGGEPTLHPQLPEMIAYNNRQDLKTTIYTNGFGLEKLEFCDLKKTEVRVGIYGLFKSEKPLAEIKKPGFPVTFVYMLRRNNTSELLLAAKRAEKEFGCKKFFISSIRDIIKTGSYWGDTEETLSLYEYYMMTLAFLTFYSGKMEIHIAKRGVITTGKEIFGATRCRFGNILTDGRKIICPFDIPKLVTADRLMFNERKCTKSKNGQCLLQKNIFMRI